MSRKKKYFLRQSDQLIHLKNKNPKEIWKLLNKKTLTTSISLMSKVLRHIWKESLVKSRLLLFSDIEDFIDHRDSNINNPTFPIY